MPDFNLRRWEGSLTTSLDPEQTSPGDFDRLVNFVYDENGLPRVRGGLRLWENHDLAAAEEVSGLYHFTQGWAGARPRDWVIRLSNSGVYKSSFPNQASWQQILDMSSTNDSGNKLTPSFTSLRGWLIFTSDSEILDKPRYWSGRQSEMTRLDAAPDAFLCASHSGRLWVVDQNEPSTIHFSELYSPNKWRLGFGSGQLKVQPGDGNSISALVPGYAGEMIIFKDGPNGGATYRLQGRSLLDFTIVPMSTTIGAISQRCTTMVGDKDIFFGSRRGLHSLRRVFQHGDLESANIDVEVSDKWRALSDRQKRVAVGVDNYLNDTWWLFLDTDGDDSNDTGLLFNYRHKTSRENPKVSTVDFGSNAATMIRDAANTKNRMMIGGAKKVGSTISVQSMIVTDEDSRDLAGVVTGGTSYETDIAWEAQIMPIDVGDPWSIKSWQEAWFKYDSWGWADIDVEWYADNQRPSSATFSMNPDQMPASHRGNVRVNESRTLATMRRQMNSVHLRRGGTSLVIKLSGTQGRTALRSLRIVYEVQKPNLMYGRVLPYTHAQHK